MSQGENDNPLHSNPPTPKPEMGWAKGMPMKAGVIMVANIILMSVIMAYGISSGNNVPFVTIAWLGMMTVPLLVVGLVRAGRIK